MAAEEHDPVNIKTHCKHGHLWSEFGFINTNGYRACRACVRTTSRKYSHNHPEKDLDRKRRERERNPEKDRAKARRWRAANPEKSRAMVYKWLVENPEKKRASDRRWAAANPEKIRAKKPQAACPQTQPTRFLADFRVCLCCPSL